MKAGREHRVPLSAPVVALPRKMAAIRQDELVFRGRDGKAALSNMSLLMTLRRLGRTDLASHGFRSTARDWAAEHTNFPSELAEMALAHAVGDRVEAAYRRGDMLEKRRALADAWGANCTEPPAGAVLIKRAS
jgi:integrase